MTKHHKIEPATLGTAIAAVLAVSLGQRRRAAPAVAQPPAAPTARPQVLLSVGEGQMVKPAAAVADVWTSNPAVADVYVTARASSTSSARSRRGHGDRDRRRRLGRLCAPTSASARTSARSTRCCARRCPMPTSRVTSRPDGGAQRHGRLAGRQRPGRAAGPADAQPGHRSQPGATLKIVPVNRLKTATPLQVMLQVQIAEVNRSCSSEIGVNLLSSDSTSGFKFGIGQGRSRIHSPAAGGTEPPFRRRVIRSAVGTTFGAAGKLFGLDIARRARSRRDRRPGDHSRRAEPDRAFG